MAAPRSYLYVPGDRPDFLVKAGGRGADALIVDLEDAVAPDAKGAARTAVRSWLDSVDEAGLQIWVRINPGNAGRDDLSALVGSNRVDGFCLAKADSAEDVQAVSVVLDHAGSDAALMPLLESARAVFNAQAIAAGPRVKRVQIGEIDLAADAGIVASPSGVELSWARSRVVFASAAAGIAPPLAAVSADFRDVAAFTESTETLRRMGFFGRACIHPSQVAVANAAFSFAAEQTRAAHELLELQRVHGDGAFVGPDGRMVDEAVLRGARRIVSQSERGSVS